MGRACLVSGEMREGHVVQAEQTHSVGSHKPPSCSVAGKEWEETSGKGLKGLIVTDVDTLQTPWGS